MPTVDGEGEDQPVGRVVVLEDLDQDGRMDRSTVFLDGLVLPRALALVEGGVLVAEPPQLLYCRDLDGDLKCDQKTVVGSYASNAPDVLEHTDNGLMLALDNWMYNAKSTRRLRFRDGRLEEGQTSFRGQWGIAQDNQGRLYYNTNSAYLYGDLFPSIYQERNPNCGPAIRQPAGVGRRIVTDEAVHSIRVNLGINRGYQPEMLLPDGRLKRTTAVSGLCIYRGQQFPPDYVGDAFIPEPAANLVTHHRIESSGLELRAEQVLTPDPDFGQRAFLASTDERFRPVDCEVGPDGALYVVDMYRGILQHRTYVTSFLRRQILERKLDRPLGLGRIYRVRALEREIDHAAPRLDTTLAQVKALSHPGGWWRDTAQRLLVEDRSEAAADQLLDLIRGDQGTPLARVHALFCLAGMDRLGPEVVWKALGDEAAAVRRAALQVSEQLSVDELDDRFDMYATRIEEPEATVRIQLLFSIGSLPFGLPQLELVWSVLKSCSFDPYARLAALSGWGAREVEALEFLLACDDEPDESDGSGELTGYLDLLRELALAAIRKQPERSAALLALIEQEDEPARRAALVEGALLWTGDKAYRPVALKARPGLFRAAAEDPTGATNERIALLAQAYTWPGSGKQADAQSAVVPLTAGDRDRMEAARPLYQQFCQTCHGADGQGLAATGPPLAGSEWVLGPEERLVRIVLQGLHGPVEVNGTRWDLLMPPLGVLREFNDEKIAGVLTLVRRSWGHAGAPVRPETVRRIREETRDRVLPWMALELKYLGQSIRGRPLPQEPIEESPWIDLFDGKTLSGWERLGGQATYRVEADAIVGTTVPNTPNTFLCTERRFGDFELEVEFQVDPRLNSGVQIRSSLLDGRVRGYQIEIDPDQERRRDWTAGIYEEGLRGWLFDLKDHPEARAAFRTGEWNRIRVEARGARLRTWLNSVPAADLLDARTQAGFIGLQVHGVGGLETPLEIRWRKLRLLDHGQSQWRPVEGFRLPDGAGVLIPAQGQTEFARRIRLRVEQGVALVEWPGGQFELKPAEPLAWIDLYLVRVGDRLLLDLEEQPRGEQTLEAGTEYLLSVRPGADASTLRIQSVEELTSGE